MRLASAVLCSSADSTSEKKKSCNLHEPPTNDNFVYWVVIVFAEQKSHYPLILCRILSIVAINELVCGIDRVRNAGLEK